MDKAMAREDVTHLVAENCGLVLTVERLERERDKWKTLFWTVMLVVASVVVGCLLGLLVVPPNR